MFELRKKAIQGFLRVVPRMDPRKVLKGVAAKMKDGKVRLAATDGKVALIADVERGGAESASIAEAGIIPDHFLRFVSGMVSTKKGERVALDVNAYAVAKNGRRTVTDDLIEGHYPDIEYCFPGQKERPFDDLPTFRVNVRHLKRLADALYDIAEAGNYAEGARNCARVYVKSLTEGIVFAGELGPDHLPVRAILMPIKLPGDPEAYWRHSTRQRAMIAAAKSWGRKGCEATQPK